MAGKATKLNSCLVVRSLHMHTYDRTGQICKITVLLVDQRLDKDHLGRQQLEDLLNQSYPVTDPTTLSLLETLAQLYHGDASLTGKLGLIWERAAEGFSGNNEWIYNAWFESKFRKGLHKEAKQVRDPLL